MDTQEIKSNLKSLKRLNTMIDSKLETLSRLRQMSTSVSAISTQERVQSSVSGDNMSAVVAKIIDLEATVNNEISKYADTYKTMEELINKVEDRDCRTLLTLRYLNYKTWEKIAEEMNYSSRWVRGRLYGKAINALIGIINSSL